MPFLSDPLIIGHDRDLREDDLLQTGEAFLGICRDEWKRPIHGEAFLMQTLDVSAGFRDDGVSGCRIPGGEADLKIELHMKACLMEGGFEDDTRHTVDIDGNWYSDETPSSEQMVESIQRALDENDIPLKVHMYRMYGEGRSAGFELKDPATDEIIFTMDIDVNRPEILTKIYEAEGIKFRGSVLNQMIADKVSAISTNKVFRRIKDVVDLYYYSQVFEFDREKVMKILGNSGRTIGDYDGFINRIDELKHSYEKFRFSGDVTKSEFEEVYNRVKDYISDILPRI